MSDRYTVKPSDNLSKIARRHGYPSWRVIYNHPENADFRRRRPNPNQIRPGDVLILPDRRSEQPTRAALFLPWNFASRLRMPSRLWLDPISLSDLSAIRPDFSPAPLNLNPRSVSPTGPRAISLCGPVRDAPQAGTSAPVRGGSGTALRWVGRALLRCQPVKERVDGAKDWALDFAWRTAPPWRRGLVVGLGLAGATVLLSIKPTREFIREQAHGHNFGLGFLGIDWLGVQPRLGINGDWGGVINFNLQNIISGAQ